MIYVIIGTRAQLIKMAPLISLLESNGYTFTLLHTGQHVESLDEICNDFNIITKWHSLYDGKEVSSIWQALIWCLTLIFKKFSDQFATKNSNNLILVHGDTLSTLLGAILGKRHDIPVAHIESGLRSFNLLNPFPEELTRLLTFRLSKIAFCPSDWALANLKSHTHIEKINTKGNTIIDALQFISSQTSNFKIPAEIYGVISIHRFENIFFQTRFKTILKQIINIAKKYKLVFVLHPSTRKRLHKSGYFELLAGNKNIELRPRTGYKNFITLLTNSKFVITDGGSNQEELSILGIPTYLMRNSTERQDGLGKNIMLGKFSNTKLNNFIQNIDDYTFPQQHIDHSPSAIILASIKRYGSIA